LGEEEESSSGSRTVGGGLGGAGGAGGAGGGGGGGSGSGHGGGHGGGVSKRTRDSHYERGPHHERDYYEREARGAPDPHHDRGGDYYDRDRSYRFQPYPAPGHDLRREHEMSNTLYVEGVPMDATQREMTHIFRPFYGYRAVRLIKNGKAKKPDGRDYYHCFAEFITPEAANTAMTNLQSYKMDYDDRTGLRISFSFSERKGTRSRGSDRPY